MKLSYTSMWRDPSDVALWPTPEIVDTIRSAQSCQRQLGMTHPLNPIWSRAINEGCAEIGRRIAAGDDDAKAVRL